MVRLTIDTDADSGSTLSEYCLHRLDRQSYYGLGSIGILPETPRIPFMASSGSNERNSHMNCLDASTAICAAFLWSVNRGKTPKVYIPKSLDIPIPFVGSPCAHL